MQPTFRIAAFAGVFVVSSVLTALAAPARSIQIRWDFTAATPSQLEIWVDCAQPSDDLLSCDDDSRVIRAPDAYRFELKRTDGVMLITIGTKNGDAGSAEYAITGTNLDEKDLDQLKKLLAATGGSSGAVERRVAPGNTAAPPLKRAVYVNAVTDKLIAGGKLTTTFNLKTVSGTGSGAKETVTQTSGGLTFHVRPESPRLTVSAGIAFSTAPDPKVAVVKTSTLVTFTNQGKDQQAYQQVITLSDTDTALRPVQSLMTVVNFRVYDRVYASAGIRVDEKIFEQPVLGVTYRHPLGDRLGLNATAGIMFSKETEILPESGFVAGQTVDPAAGLTADDIPTRTRYHRRFAMLLSLDF